jgi:hypothetical protein
MMYSMAPTHLKGATMPSSTVFERELEYYAQHKATYLEQFPGLFVLIKGDRMLGPFPSAESAYTTGLHTFGLVPFLVKQVLKREPVGSFIFISRISESDADL